MNDFSLVLFSKTKLFLRWCRYNPITTLGFAVVIGVGVLGLLAPLIAPFDPYALNPRDRMLGPSWEHLFGTGTMGEDIFSRVRYGALIDFGIGFGAVFVGLVVGSSVGVIAGYFGGKADEIAMRLMDMIAAFP